MEIQFISKIFIKFENIFDNIFEYFIEIYFHLEASIILKELDNKFQCQAEIIFNEILLYQ